LIISADNFEDSELLVPYYRLKEEGIEVVVASMSRGTITGTGTVKNISDERRPTDWSYSRERTLQRAKSILARAKIERRNDGSILVLTVFDLGKRVE
jgi:putative intracellular protease/amidase